MSGDPVPGQSVTAGFSCAPAADPAAERGINAAPGPKGDLAAVGADNEVPQCVSDGASAACAASSGTAVQSAKLVKVKRQNGKRRPTEFSIASSSWPAAHILTQDLWGPHMHNQCCLYAHTAYPQTNNSTELLSNYCPKHPVDATCSSLPVLHIPVTGQAADCVESTLVLVTNWCGAHFTMHQSCLR